MSELTTPTKVEQTKTSKQTPRRQLTREQLAYEKIVQSQICIPMCIATLSLEGSYSLRHLNFHECP